MDHRRIGRPLTQGWCFQDKIPNATFDWRFDAFATRVDLITPKSRENNDGRGYFDYAGIRTYVVEG